MSDVPFEPDQDAPPEDVADADSDGQSTPPRKPDVDWRVIAIIAVAVLFLLAIYVNKKYYRPKDRASTPNGAPTDVGLEPPSDAAGPSEPPLSPAEQYANLITRREVEVTETLFLAGDRPCLIARPPIPIRSREDPSKVVGLDPGRLFDVSERLEGVTPQMLHRRGLPGRREIAFMDTFPPLGLSEGVSMVFKPAEDVQLYPAVRRADMQWYLYDWDPLYVPFGTVEAIDVAFEQAKPCNTYFYALYVEDEIGRSDVNVANMCKAETESSFQITIKVQAEGTWDDAGAPDFYAEMTFDSIEPVVFDPVPGSHTAEFQFEVGKDKWWGSKLTVGEFDAGKNEIFVKAKVDNYFGYANMLCTRHKKFKYADKSSNRVATVDLTIRKCY